MAISETWSKQLVPECIDDAVEDLFNDRLLGASVQTGTVFMRQSVAEGQLPPLEHCLRIPLANFATWEPTRDMNNVAFNLSIVPFCALESTVCRHQTRNGDGNGNGQVCNDSFVGRIVMRGWKEETHQLDSGDELGQTISDIPTALTNSEF